MRPLRPGLDPGEAACDRILDRLVITAFEMKKGKIREAAPVPSIERLAPDEIERAGVDRPLFLAHDQRAALPTALAKNI